MMKTTLFSCLAASALLVVCGCGTTSTSTTTTTGTAGGPAKDWKADFLRQRDEAEANARLAKAKLKPGSDEFGQAQSRYQRAKSAVNLLLEGIQSSIRDGQNPMASPFYPSRSQEAEQALLNFNNYVTRTVLSPDMQPKFLPLVLPLVTSLGGAIWDKVAAANARSAQERKVIYERTASELNGVRFSDFVDIRD
jgi:hypothetical protein